MAGKPWTSQELSLLKERYHAAGLREIMALLPGRTRNAVMHRAAREGLASDRLEVWRDGERRCAKCRTWKSLDDFTKNKQSPSGKGIYCRPCLREVNAASRHDRKVWALRRKYGMTLEQFEHLYLNQKGRCAICERPIFYGCGVGHNIMVCVDHDHKTGRPRGLLCEACNFAIGALRDDPDIMRRAAAYLEWHNQSDSLATSISEPEESLVIQEISNVCK